MYINKKESSTKIGPISSTLQSTESVIRLVRELANDAALFYEMESVEVIEVHNDPTTSTFPKLKDGSPNYGKVGSIIGRYVNSEEGKNIDSLKTFNPLNPLINTTPVIGELVIGVEYLGKRYYISTLNLGGNTAQNTLHNISQGPVKNTLKSKEGLTIERSDDSDLSTGKFFKNYKDTDPRRLLPEDGDVILQGRFNQGIRFGSDIKNDKLESSNILISTGLNKEGETGDKKKIGEPITELPDKDGSTLYLSSKQTFDDKNKLKFTPSKESEVTKKLDTFEGNQIYIGSDRIILNSKLDDIFLTSKNNITLSSTTSTVIETPLTKVGSNNANNPVAFGDVVEEVFNLVFSILSNGLLAPTGPVKVGPGAGDLAAAKAAVKRMLSKKHFTE